MIQRWFIVWICLHFSLGLGAQNTPLVLQGKIVAAADGQVVPFAHVYIENTTLGTLSNAHGAFYIEIAPTYAQHFLVVSSIGFEKQRLPIAQLTSTVPLVVKLQADVTELSAIGVSSKKLTPQQILKKCMDRFSKNYLAQRYELDAFFQTTAFHPWREEPLLSLYELLVKIQDKGIHTHSDSSVAMQVWQMRKGKNILPAMSIADSLTLSYMAQVIMGQRHYNELFVTYAADVVRHQIGSSLTASPFRNEAVLAYQLESEGVVRLDSVWCYKIVSNGAGALDENEKAGQGQMMSYEAYKKMLPPNVSQRVADSLYQVFTQAFAQDTNKRQILSSARQHVFYIDIHNFALLRYERSVMYGRYYLSNWVDYGRVGKKYYPTAMCAIRPVFYREKNTEPGKQHHCPYVVSTMLVTGVKIGHSGKIPDEALFRSSDYVQELEAPYQAADWQNMPQIPFDAQLFEYILQKVGK
ncbi:MAG TPA: hypothetical protein DCM08_12800 [Microscillaceae bacterium]|jgi:hypothetical protein|nr:hypothetical protein [Microscillaceae bacterium]